MSLVFRHVFLVSTIIVSSDADDTAVTLQVKRTAKEDTTTGDCYWRAFPDF